MRVNIEAAMSADSSAFGISLKALQEVRKELAGVQEEYRAAVEADLIPFTIELEKKRERAKEWQAEFSSFDEIWVIGEPSVLGSLQMLVSDSPLANTFHWISSADPQRFLLLQDEKRRLALLLTAVAWGQQVAQLVQASFEKIILCIGDGTEQHIEPWGEKLIVFSEDGIADSRFALFSSLAFSLMADVDQAVNRFSTQIKELDRRGMWENPSALLACALRSVESEQIPTQILLIGARDSWEGWLRWAEMIWKGMGSVQHQIGGLQRQVQGAASAFILGDELGINQLGMNSKERLLCLFEEREPKVQEITEQLIEIWNISNQQVDDFLSFADQKQYPVIGFQIQKLSGIELLLLSVRWVHTIMLLNALRGTNPLAMWGADQWRLFQAAK